MSVLVFAMLLLIPALDFTGVEPQVKEKIERLQSEVMKHPQSAEAWGKLAMNLHAHDFRKESLQCYEQAAKLDPQNFHWNYYAAVAQQEINSSEAIPLFEKASKLKPSYAPLHLRFGASLFASGKYEDAKRQFQQAIQYDPSSANAYVGLARTLLTTNNVEDARVNLLTAMQLNAKEGEVHGLLSEVYRLENQPEKAEQELLLSQQLPKKIPPPDPELREFLLEGVSSYWCQLRGEALLQQGDYEGAIRQLKLAVKALPDPRFYDQLGIAYQYQKKYREAIEQHLAALALNPKSAATMSNLATAYAALGQKREAIAMLQRAQQLLPDNSVIALKLAWLLATSKPPLQNAHEALHFAETVCEKNHFQDAESLDVLSVAYASLGQFNKAIDIAQKAEQLAASPDMKKRIESHLSLYAKKQPVE